MSNNDLNNDFDDNEEFSEDASFESFDKKGGSLGEMWRNNPLVKLGVILGGFAAVVGGVILFGGSETKVQPSRMPNSSDVAEAPGTEEISQDMQSRIADLNQQRVEQAIMQGTSAIPTPTNPVREPIQAIQEDVPEEDPLTRWKRLQDQRQNQPAPAQPAQQAQQAPADPHAEVRNTLAQAMAAAMKELDESKDPKELSYMTITKANYSSMLTPAEGVAAGPGGTAMAPGQSEEPIQVIQPAATIEYAQMITEANTDAPGPVLAVIWSGPLKGSRLIGGFQNTEEFLTISFNTLVRDGISYPVTAIALDIKTTLPGMATEIDRRYFRRVVLPAAAAFVEGVGSAVAESNKTEVSIDGDVVATETQDVDTKQELAKGFETASEELGDILDSEMAKVKPMIKVHSGTPFGLLFLEPVIDQPKALPGTQQPMAGFGLMPGGGYMMQGGQQLLQQGGYYAGAMQGMPAQTGYNSNYYVSQGMPVPSGMSSGPVYAAPGNYVAGAGASYMPSYNTAPVYGNSYNAAPVTATGKP